MPLSHASTIAPLITARGGASLAAADNAALDYPGAPLALTSNILMLTGLNESKTLVLCPPPPPFRGSYSSELAVRSSIFQSHKVCSAGGLGRRLITTFIADADADVNADADADADGRARDASGVGPGY
ncbi:hypothetical protein EVAR_29928_1 [Eumeta japonica]|uniref:Uncharacterized protein n=1 Tax=Eumeta variegata TaxID=151549 RepID=A0A4C1V6T5_EUMVA|nr:hypothetical protein EVAR_29928_1 [Eumeta japonica]